MPLPPGVGSTARRLFSEHFLAERLPAWEEFAELDFAELHGELLELWRSESAGLPGANEGQTEERFIRPVLARLGHAFNLFAEARGLLPVSNDGYRRYSVAHQRQEVSVLVDGRRPLSATHDGLFAELRALFRMIDRATATYCRARFAAAFGSFDVYAVFVERALALLAPHGRLGFIVPNKLFKLDFGERLRARFAAEELVDEVIDFGASQVFAGATNYTCILVLDRSRAPELAYRSVRGSRREVLEALATAGALPAQRFPTRRLGGEPWVLVPPDEAAVIRAAADGSERLDAVTRQIFQGLVTSADPVYVLEDPGSDAADGRRRVP